MFQVEEEETGPKPILPYSSFFILSSTNPLRRLIHWIVTKKIFDMFIMLIIILSSIALASEDPVHEDSPRNKILGLADYGFTAIFTMECTLKILDLGFVLHPGGDTLNKLVKRVPVIYWHFLFCMLQAHTSGTFGTSWTSRWCLAPSSHSITPWPGHPLARS